MADYAHVLDGCVMNVYRGISDPAVDLPALHAAGVLVAADPGVEPGWRDDRGTLVAPPAPPESTTRGKRRAEYFAALKVEPGDDQITVLGDQVDKIIAQVEAIRVAAGAARTAEFDALIKTVAAIKAKLPKPPPAG